jgi:hypothetical protein
LNLRPPGYEHPDTRPRRLKPSPLTHTIPSQQVHTHRDVSPIPGCPGYTSGYTPADHSRSRGPNSVSALPIHLAVMLWLNIYGPITGPAGDDAQSLIGQLNGGRVSTGYSRSASRGLSRLGRLLGSGPDSVERDWVSRGTGAITAGKEPLGRGCGGSPGRSADRSVSAARVTPTSIVNSARTPGLGLGPPCAPSHGCVATREVAQAVTHRET